MTVRTGEADRAKPIEDVVRIVRFNSGRLVINHKRHLARNEAWSDPQMRVF